MDDVASHIRLFREAKATFKSKSESSKDLATHFFHRELEREKDVCRDNISLKPEVEKGS